MRKHLKLIAGGAATVGLSLAACGGGNGGTGRASASGTNGVVIQAGQGARLSGTYSALDLSGWVPDSLYPSDITEAPDGAYNTNSRVGVNAKYNATSDDCSTVLDETAGPGWGEQAYLLDQGENAAKNAFYSYSVYEFPAASDAVTFVKGLAAKYAVCGSFTVNAGNGNSFPGSMSLGPSSEAAVPAANTAVDVRQSATNNGETVVGDYLFAADGNVVVCAGVADSTGRLPTEVNETKVAQELLSAFAKGEAAWVAAGTPSDYTTATPAPTPAVSQGDKYKVRMYSTGAASWAEFDGVRFAGTIGWAGGVS